MKADKSMVFLWLAIASTVAFAAGNTGTYTIRGKASPMTAVYAERTISEAGSTIVLFTDRPDLAHFDEAEAKAQGDYANPLGCAILARGGKVVYLKMLHSMSVVLSTYGKDCHDSVPIEGHPVINLNAFNDARVAGSVRSADKKFGTSVDLSFELPLHNGDHHASQDELNRQDALSPPPDAPPPPPPPPPPPRKHA